MRSILVPTQIFDSLHRRLARLADKAGISLAIVPGETKVYRKACERRYNVMGEMYRVWYVDTRQVLPCSRLTIGELPACNGFAFIGKIEHTEAGNMIKMAAGSQDESLLPVGWRDAKPTCDHCNTQRNRTETFLIRNPEGAIVRVGRNCLQDFTRGSAESMIALDLFEDTLRSVRDSDDEGSLGGSGYSWHIDTLHYIASAVSACEKGGYVKADNEQGRPSTKSRAMFIAGSEPTGNTPEAREARADWKANQPTVEHMAQAVAAVLWLAEQDGKASGYIHNMQVGAQLHAATPSNMGLLASLPTAYARAMGQLAEKKARPESSYFGTVKSRVTVAVTVTYVTSYETAYGVKYVIGMRTDDGCDLVVKTTGEHPVTSDVGKRFTVKGTIKEHAEYKGRKQTVMQRAVWTALELEPATA